MADVKDAKAKLTELRQLMATARDDLTRVGLDLPDDLGSELKVALQKMIENASVGIHTVVMSVAELEEGLDAL